MVNKIDVESTQIVDGQPVKETGLDEMILALHEGRISLGEWDQFEILNAGINR